MKPTIRSRRLLLALCSSLALLCGCASQNIDISEVEWASSAGSDGTKC